MTYSTMATTAGWCVLLTVEGVSRSVCMTGLDEALATQVRDWLTHRERIAALLEREGLVDVPLMELP